MIGKLNSNTAPHSHSNSYPDMHFSFRNTAPHSHSNNMHTIHFQYSGIYFSSGVYFSNTVPHSNSNSYPDMHTIHSQNSGMYFRAEPLVVFDASTVCLVQ